MPYNYRQVPVVFKALCESIKRIGDERDVTVRSSSVALAKEDS